MASQIAAAALQYSKQLSRFICWVWAVYRFSVIVLSAAKPDASSALVSTIPGLDTIMMINVSCYLINSLGEKILYSDRYVLKWIEKGGFKHLLGFFGKNVITEDETTESSEG